ncbi:MAG TPA: hypothetical protein VHF45_12015 [Thermoleophilaceae bacterium]|nr:hypothetical protein [Thermoleophilaceae bacterium]
MQPLRGDDRDRLNLPAELFRDREGAPGLGTERGAHRGRVPRRQNTHHERQGVQTMLPQPARDRVSVGAGAELDCDLNVLLLGRHAVKWGIARRISNCSAIRALP